MTVIAINCSFQRDFTDRNAVLATELSVCRYSISVTNIDRLPCREYIEYLFAQLALMRGKCDLARLTKRPDV